MRKEKVNTSLTNQIRGEKHRVCLLLLVKEIKHSNRKGSCDQGPVAGHLKWQLGSMKVLHRSHTQSNPSVPQNFVWRARTPFQILPLHSAGGISSCVTLYCVSFSV